MRASHFFFRVVRQITGNAGFIFAIVIIAATGDLDVSSTVATGNKTVNINGAGPASTTITGIAGDRVFDVHAVNNAGSIVSILAA